MDNELKAGYDRLAERINLPYERNELLVHIDNRLQGFNDQIDKSEKTSRKQYRIGLCLTIMNLIFAAVAAICSLIALLT